MVKKVLVDDWKTLKQQFQLYINYGNILTFGEYILTKGTKKSLIYVWISVSKIFSMKEMIQYI